MKKKAIDYKGSYRKVVGLHIKHKFYQPINKNIDISYSS